MGQCLLNSAQMYLSHLANKLDINKNFLRLTDGDRQHANISYQQYLEDLKESEQEKKKKFVCDLCSFRAMTAMGLKKHLKKQHPYPD